MAFYIFRLFENFPDGFSTVPYFQMVTKLSGRLKTIQIFPVDFKIFQMVSKLSRYLDSLKNFWMVQNCPDLSSWLQNLLDNFKTVHIFPDSFKTFRMVQNYPNLSVLLQNLMQRCFGAKYQFLFETVQKGPDEPKRVLNGQKKLGWPFWFLSDRGERIIRYSNNIRILFE